MITMTRNDLMNVAKNGFYVFAHEVIGGGTALIVDKLAHKIFSIKENTYFSYAAKAGSCLAGYAVCHYLAPQTPLISFTGRVACELCVAAFATSLLFPNIGPRMVQGSIMGYFGNVGPFSFSGFEAALRLTGLKKIVNDAINDAFGIE